MTRAVDPLCTVVHGGTGTTSCGSWGTDVAQAGRHKFPSPPPLVSKQPPRKVQLCQEKRKQKVLLGWAEVLLQMFRLLQDFVREGERKGETAGERKFLSSFKRSTWLQWKGKRTQDSSGGSRISPDLVKVLSAPCSATASLPKPQGARYRRGCSARGRVLAGVCPLLWPEEGPRSSGLFPTSTTSALLQDGHPAGMVPVLSPSQEAQRAPGLSQDMSHLQTGPEGGHSAEGRQPGWGSSTEPPPGQAPAAGRVEICLVSSSKSSGRGPASPCQANMFQ